MTGLIGGMLAVGLGMGHGLRTPEARPEIARLLEDMPRVIAGIAGPS